MRLFGDHPVHVGTADLALALPIAEERVAEERVAEETLADVLSEFARTMVTDFAIQGILDHLVQRIVDIMPITAAGVTLIAPGIGPQYVAASNGSALRYEKLQTELSEGPCVAAYHTGSAVSVPDLGREERFPAFAARALESGLAAVFTFPLRHDEFQLGALDLYRDTAGPLSRAAIVAAQTLADVAAAYLINAQARADLLDSSEQSREAALHDPLTGLPNRVLMLQLLERAFRAGRRSGRVSGVMFLDLDRFKDVNDTYGHQIGDELLMAVADRLSGLLRPGDSLARLSGDEFVVLCEDLEDESAIDPIAVRLDAELCRPFILSGIEVTVTASIGVALTSHRVDSADQLLRDADLAMYQSKRGRVRTQGVLDLRRLHLAGHQVGLAHALPGAIDRGEMHLEYQPIVDTADGRVTGVEALLRWIHPVRGPVSPTVFIPFAEQSGQIVELGRWVLEQACADLWRWQSPTSIAMSVNVSAHQFMSGGFAQTVGAVLSDASIDPSLLTLEVTESVFVRDEERAVVVLSELKRTGVKLALDDFGTGYSALSYLNALPIDTLKVDRTFIAKLADHLSSYKIMTAIIALAHSLEMAVVAEGIETARQHQEVSQLGSDRCQGFYFARPMRAALIEPLVRVGPDGTIPSLPAAPRARGQAASKQGS
jgi:diguanylate cyclase (GGDEF)-like protein